MSYSVEIIQNGQQRTVKWIRKESKAGESMAITFQNSFDLMEFCEVFETAKNILLGNDNPPTKDFMVKVYTSPRQKRKLKKVIELAGKIKPITAKKAVKIFKKEK